MIYNFLYVKRINNLYNNIMYTNNMYHTDERKRQRIDTQKLVDKLLSGS